MHRFAQQVFLPQNTNFTCGNVLHVQLKRFALFILAAAVAACNHHQLPHMRDMHAAEPTLTLIIKILILSWQFPQCVCAFGHRQLMMPAVLIYLHIMHLNCLLAAHWCLLLLSIHPSIYIYIFIIHSLTEWLTYIHTVHTENDFDNDALISKCDRLCIVHHHHEQLGKQAKDEMRHQCVQSRPLFLHFLRLVSSHLSLSYIARLLAKAHEWILYSARITRPNTVDERVHRVHDNDQPNISRT